MSSFFPPLNNVNQSSIELLMIESHLPINTLSSVCKTFNELIQQKFRSIAEEYTRQDEKRFLSSALSDLNKLLNYRRIGFTHFDFDKYNQLAHQIQYSFLPIAENEKAMQFKKSKINDDRLQSIKLELGRKIYRDIYYHSQSIRLAKGEVMLTIAHLTIEKLKNDLKLYCLHEYACLVLVSLSLKAKTSTEQTNQVKMRQWLESNKKNIEDLPCLYLNNYDYLNHKGRKTRLPDEIKYLKNITLLDFSLTSFSSLSVKNINNLTNLVSISLYGTDLPKDILENLFNFKRIKLKYLNISNTGICPSSFNKILISFPNLEYLEAKNKDCIDEDQPEENFLNKYFYKMNTSLRKRKKQQCEIQENLPELNLKSLVLDGQCFNIKSLSYLLGKTSQLKNLSMQNCDLIKIPKEIFDLHDLKEIDLSDNNLDFSLILYLKEQKPSLEVRCNDIYDEMKDLRLPNLVNQPVNFNQFH